MKCIKVSDFTTAKAEDSETVCFCREVLSSRDGGLETAVQEKDIVISVVSSKTKQNKPTQNQTKKPTTFCCFNLHGPKKH